MDAEVLTSPPPPNYSKSWSELVKMENISSKLIKVAGQTWQKLVKVEIKVGKIW